MSKMEDLLNKTCIWCGRRMHDGGVGDFSEKMEYMTFCGPECRTEYWNEVERKRMEA